MAKTVFVVRHGQTAANVTGFYSGWSEEDLNEVGCMQASRLAARLAQRPIGAVYASPLRRAYTTAEILAEPHGLGVVPLDDLKEIHLGDWQGLYEDEIRQRWPDLWQQSMTDPSEISLPNGETFGQVAGRAVRAFEAVLSSSPAGEAVIVTHDMIVRILAAYVLGVPTSIYRRLEIGNASLTVITAGDNSRQLVTMNDTSHLDGLTLC